MSTNEKSLHVQNCRFAAEKHYHQLVDYFESEIRKGLVHFDGDNALRFLRAQLINTVQSN